MGQVHEVAELRRRLRDMLMADRYEGAEEVLARFLDLAINGREVASPQLIKEYERWRARVEILAAPPPLF